MYENMAPMANWPTSRSMQAGIASVGSSVLAIIVYKVTFDHQIAYYVQAYPHDGQDGLGAFMDGLYASAASELIGFIVIFLLQIFCVSKRKPKE
jgi:hypothetical protein